MFNFFKRKTLAKFEVSVRDLAAIHRFIADGFKVVFKGAVAVLTKWVKA